MFPPDAGVHTSANTRATDCGLVRYPFVSYVEILARAGVQFLAFVNMDEARKSESSRRE